MNSPLDMVTLDMNVAMPAASFDAVPVLQQIGAQIGYGRAIQVLQEAWRAKNLADGFSIDSADKSCGLVCVWCGVDRRTGKKAKKRKVGAR